MKSLKIISGIVVVMALNSCQSQLAGRIEDYVSDVEDESTTWTDADWTKSQDEFEKLMEEYERNYDSYSQAEKDAINKAIGRYNGLLIRQGLENVYNIVDEFSKQFPSFLDGFMSAFTTDETEK